MITKFRDRFAFLSNFYYVDINFEGIIYDSVEHAYQAAKTDDIDYKKMVARCVSPRNARRKGQKFDLSETWNEDKLVIMEKLLKIKFKNDKMKNWLLATNDEKIIEKNTWNDTFWGVCKGIGENYLGRLLMKIRNELNTSFDFDFIKDEIEKEL